MFSKFLAAVLLLGGTAMAAQPVFAQSEPEQPGAQAEPAPAEETMSEGETAPAAEAESAPADPVIARVDGEDILQSDLVAFIQTLPPQIQGQVGFLMPQLVEQMVNNALVTSAGRKADMAADPEVMARLAQFEDIIIRQVFIQRTIDARTTPERLDSAYQAYLEENPPQPELVARHILVETEDAAKALIVELDGGADFAKLAEENSVGPSKANGGELPPFVAGDMVPEFSDAAFAMEAGSHSAAPVQTQFGFHIIKVEERRMTEPPSQEALEAQLREQLAQEVVQDLYAELRERADVEVLLGRTAEEEPAASESETPEQAEPEAGSTNQ
ncbi:MAG TPA: peptidylprolyl isomerase [Kiloniellaceae bacterium]|nr:peptidylprolyl isomerase [Kiloniellaceae bacterium]HIP79854.1 peptidylprolyl isomerase [Kiloniellaceae bacterium]